MKGKKLFILALATLSFSAMADITVSSKEGGQYNSYELSASGNDAKVLSSVLGEKSITGSLNTGIEGISCSDESLCLIKIGADQYHEASKLNNADLFKENADSILKSDKDGVALSSPTEAFYWWAQTRKEHAKNDKDLYNFLKNSKSKLVVENKSDLGTRYTVKSDNLNLSCIKLKKAYKFEYSMIDFGPMGGIGTRTKSISYICQLNLKAKE